MTGLPRFTRVRCLPALLAVYLIAPAPCASADAPAEVVADTQDFFFLGGGPPILVRVRILIDEKPLSAVWREAVIKLHAYLDANGDGTLKPEEVERVEWPKLVPAFGNPVRAPAAMSSRAPAPPPLPAMDSRPADGVISVEELAEFLRALRGPFTIQGRPLSELDQDTTFVRIDADGDKILTPGERDRAAVALRMFDLNDDDSLSSLELARFRNPVFGFVGMAASKPEEPPLVLLDPGSSRIRMVHQLMNRLDSGGQGAPARDHRLSRDEIGLATESFNAFDNDGDGTLDSDELMQYLNQGEPAFEILVRLGMRPPQRSVAEFVDRLLTTRGKPGLGASMKPDRLEVIDRRGQAPGAAPNARIPGGRDAPVTLDLDTVQVDLRTDEDVASLNQARAIFDSLFKQLDTDKSDSLSLSEVRGREPFQSFFTLLDRDGNGQLRKAEINAGMALLGELSRSQAMLGVADRGVLLFSGLDINGDGRLGLRELRAAGERLASFDRNADGQVSAAELPHRFEWIFSQTPISFGFAISASSRMMSQVRAGGAATGPPWFQKMDRNHDGDLSPREFLGPAADFLRLDADGDGLVDAREAVAKR